MYRASVISELSGLREQITGVNGALVAAVDGLVVAADTHDDVDADSLAAMSAAALSIAKRTSEVAQQGDLSRSVILSSCGLIAVYAIGEIALVTIIADEGLEAGLLHQQSRQAREHIRALLTEGA